MGIMPALRLARADLRTLLNESTRNTSSGVTTSRTMSVLAVAEIALAVMIVAGAAWLVQSFARLRAVDPGLDATPVLSLHLAVDRARHGGDAGIAAYLAQLEDAVRAVPGVVSAGLINRLPLGGQIQFGDVRIDGLDTPRTTSWRSAARS
jgi:hypothetical protein